MIKLIQISVKYYSGNCNKGVLGTNIILVAIALAIIWTKIKNAATQIPICLDRFVFKANGINIKGDNLYLFNYCLVNFLS